MGRQTKDVGAHGRALRLVLLGAAAAALQAAPAQAQQYNWLGGDGNWNDANWDQAGFPSLADDATIDDAVIDVHVTASAGITNLTIGDTAFSDAALFVDPGISFQIAGDGVLGAQIDAFGMLSVDGSLVANALAIGAAGEGWMIVNDGAGVTSAGAVTLGRDAMGFGTVDVYAGGAWTMLSGLTVGEDGAGELYIDGGSVSGTSVTLGANAFSEGAIFLTNGGTLSATALDIATDPDALGAVFIGGDFVPAVPGFLDVANVNMGPGTGGIAFNHDSSSYDFDAAVSGGSADNLIFMSGVTNFTADSSAFTGFALVVDPSARLNVNGQLGGVIGVISGGRLGGVGAVNDVVISFGGVLAPGNSIGAIGVNNLDFIPGGIFEVEVDASGASDFVSASGLVTIDDEALMQVLAAPGEYALNTEYFVLDAGAGDLSGAFGEVSSSSALLRPSLRYDYANGDLYLTLTRVLFDTPNRNAVASALTTIGSGPVTTAPGSGNDLDQLSGELFASLQSVALFDTQSLSGVIAERLSAFAEAPGLVQYASLDETQLASNDPGKHFWARAFGAWGDMDGDANSAALDYSRAGAMGGVDALVGADARIGASLAWIQDETEIDARRSSADTDVIDVSAYGSVDFGALMLSGALGHSWREIDTERRIAVGPLNETLRAAYDARALHAGAELSAEVLRQGDRSVTTFFSVNYVSLESDAFTEGGGVAALSVAESEQDLTSLRAGVRAQQRITDSGYVFGSLAWRHSSGGITPTSQNAFASSPGAVFSVSGAPLSEDGAALNAGAMFNLAAGLALSASYQGDIGDGASEHGASLRLTWTR